ncbi:dTDP-4-dehydrorhamnose reductase [Burkholderia multivorans]|uniref:dTDP-4-dehydrorhamnose reductase n=1 Tax=Burkholderia multivorans TaxID=87883 RepID=UPI001C24609F|nr:dTDP-4-dehydrorhamnose reductase [Burkholderia multivorans]MBU9439703.1 dTDP-4-dehydrorhamnose reductase [Burkholderia multivorans]MDN8010998.1 dTDP-4-dehydrorhamnose reductase [Burkholderia multivorans]
MIAPNSNHTILVTGISGQVGFELLRTLQGIGRVIALDRAALDLRRPDAIRTLVREARPSIIVNPAAYTAVDQAETDVVTARQINVEAPAVLAEEAKRLNAVFVHYSTDYVFDGNKTGPYVEDDATVPQSVYGVTKLEGERAIAAADCAHFIFRTSWVYGRRGKNFLLTMLRLAEQRAELRVVADQIGAPTWSATVATLTSHVLAQGVGALGELHEWAAPRSGVYHLTASGSTSWAGFAEAIFQRAALASAPRVVPIPATDYPLPARRPMNSRLDTSKLTEVFGIRPLDWRDALDLCLGGAC